MTRSILLYIFCLCMNFLQAQDTSENIFILTEINKTDCFVGEPVVANFILHSSVPAIASGQRSPAFYGFSIVDLINYKEPVSGIVQRNGKVYATSILRKVLLYPVQPGTLVIDPMYVETVSEVFDPVQSGKIELQKEIISRPVEIRVHPLPGIKPGDFSGAVGKFEMKAEMQETSFSINQQGKLIVRLKGIGNFINAGQPVVNWPQGLEGFEPVVRNELINTDSGTIGTRIYEFAFAADSPGSYQMPPVNFSYFDPSSKKYSFLQVAGPQFIARPAPTVNEKIIATGKQNPSIVLITLFVLALGIIVFIWWRKKNTKRIQLEISGQTKVKTAFTPSFSKDSLMEMSDANMINAIMRSLEQFLLKNQHDLSHSEVTEARMIRDDLQRMSYANAAERNKLETLAERCFQLFKRGHSAYL